MSFIWIHIDAEELRIDQPRVTSLTESNPKRNNYVTPNNQRIQKCKPTSSRAASKWNDYLTEDNENLELAWKSPTPLAIKLDPSLSLALQDLTWTVPSFPLAIRDDVDGAVIATGDTR